MKNSGNDISLKGVHEEEKDLGNKIFRSTFSSHSNSSNKINSANHRVTNAYCEIMCDRKKTFYSTSQNLFQLISNDVRAIDISYNMKYAHDDISIGFDSSSNSKSTRR